MAEITAGMVKALREETGQGMMECKKALAETNGDVQAARDLLRTRGQIKAEKKAARATKEGLIEIVIGDGGKSATMVEVACETDFCARNDVFKAMAKTVAQLASQASPGPVPATPAITDAVQNAFNQIGENMSYVRGIKLAGDIVGVYKHHNSRVGVMVAVQGQVDPTALSEICMHVAFHAPMGISRDDIAPEVIEHEKVIAKAQAIEQGKPEEIAEKMVVGKINKFYKDNCLLEQPFVKDETKTIQQVIGQAKITAVARFEVGETAADAPAEE